MNSFLSSFSPYEEQPFSFDSFDGGFPPSASVHSYGSFASLGGLAKQLCTIEPSSAFSVGSDRSPASSTFDDLVRDLDFPAGSDDDLFTPPYPCHDLPVPLAHDAYAPLTPPTFDSLLAPELARSYGGPISSSCSGGGGGGAPSLPQSSSGCGLELSNTFACSSSSSNLEQWLVQEAVDGSDVWPGAEPSSSSQAASWGVAAQDRYDVNSWNSETFFEPAPTWLENDSDSEPVVVTPATSTFSTVSRTPQRARSNPSLATATTGRHRLPPKPSMPALREGLADVYEDVFDGAVKVEQQAPSMFAVLGGYGGQERSLGQHWEGSTVGREMYGGGWQGPSGFVSSTLQRFEVGNYSSGPSSMAGPSTSHPYPPPTQYYTSYSPQLVYPPSSFASSSRPQADLLPTAPSSPDRPKTASSLVPQAAPSAPGPPHRASSANHLNLSLPAKARKAARVIVPPPVPSASAAASPASIPVGLNRAQALAQCRQSEQEEARLAYEKVKSEEPIDLTVPSVLIQGWAPSKTATASPSRIARALKKSPSDSGSALPSPTISPARPVVPLPRKTSRTRLPSSSSKAPSSPPKDKPITSSSWEPPADQWGATTFINYTCDDAEHLLTGVAPSGAPRKRKCDDLSDESSSRAGKKGRSAS